MPEDKVKPISREILVVDAIGNRWTISGDNWNVDDMGNTFVTAGRKVKATFSGALLTCFLDDITELEDPDSE